MEIAGLPSICNLHLSICNLQSSSPFNPHPFTPHPFSPPPMNERCTFFRLGRDPAKQLFTCRTPEALRDFVGGLDASSALEGGVAALALHRVLTNGTLEPEA